MERHCGNCGAVIYNGYAVCGNCGAPADMQPATPVPVQQKKGFDLNLGNNKNIIIIAAAAAAAVALIVIIAVVIGVTGNGYKKPIKTMAQSFEEADFDMFVDCIAEEKIDDYGNMDELEFIFEVIYDYLEDECDKGYKVKIKYNDKEKLNKDDIEDFVEDMEDEAGIKYDEDDLSKLYLVDVTLTAEGDDGDVEILDGDVYVAKYDGEWLIVEMDMDFECLEDVEKYLEKNAEDYYDFYC